jgi:hypothetical protein
LAALVDAEPVRSVTVLELDGAQRRGQEAFDYRASRANVLRRIGRGESPPTCDDCGCELDAPLPAHSPRCSRYGITDQVEHADAPLRIVAPAPRPPAPDYEASAARARERSDADDFTLEICGWCLCEVDVDEPAHRPGCVGIGKPRVGAEAVLPGLAGLEREPDRSARETPETSPGDAPEAVASASLVRGESRGRLGSRVASRSDSTDDGLDALERMDAGLPQQPRAQETPQPPAEPERSPRNPYGLQKRGRGYIWTKLALLEAIRDFVSEHDRVPQRTDFYGVAPGRFPSAKSATDLFASIDQLIIAAGFAPVPARQSRWTKPEPEAALSEREPTASDPDEDLPVQDPPVAVGRDAEVAAAEVGLEPPSRSENTVALDEVRAATLVAVSALFDLLDATAKALT